jgi:hypothetical protein
VPVYDLIDVQIAASNGRIEYSGPRVQRDIANLGYELADVTQCLCQLRAEEFLKTHLYEDRGESHDAYVTRFPRPGSEDGEIDELYIKFCMFGGSLTIELGSFHLQK